MRKSILSKVAVAAFLLSIGGTAAVKAVQDETIWVYNDSTGDATLTPDCEESENTCATLHEYFPDEPDPEDQIGEEVERDGKPVTMPGDRSSN